MSHRQPIFLLPGFVAIAAGAVLSLASSPARAQATTGLTLYSIGNPSGDATEMLELVNRSRANPAAEGQRLVDTINANDPNGGSGIDLNQLLADFQSYPFRPPLAFNAILNTTAAAHMADEIAMGQETHIGSDGSTPDQRDVAAGYVGVAGAENVSGSPGNANLYTVWEIEGGYEIDPGVPDMGHRYTILEPFEIEEVEIGIAVQTAGSWSVQDFGANQTPPLLTGVVFADNAETGFYASGEGVGGYTITAPGFSSYYAVTTVSGAYTLPLDLVPFIQPIYSTPATLPTVTVNFTDPSGKVTTRLVTLTNTTYQGAYALMVYAVEGPISAEERFDNAEADLVLSVSGGGSGSPLAPGVFPTFFNGQNALGGGVYYLTFPTGNYLGYYTFLTDANYLYHFDMGYEYVFDANDGKDGVYLYDFASSDFFYTSPGFPFPYLYDFAQKAVVYYYPDAINPGHYTTGPRYFYNFGTGQIITK